jgi:hypothetical protein
MPEMPKTRKFSKRSRDLWKAWHENPVSVRWTAEHHIIAADLIAQIEDTHELVHQRERRLQDRDIRAQERRLGLVAPPAKEEEPGPEPPQPRDAPLRVPDLGLLYTGADAVFIHPPREVLENAPSLGARVVQHIERWYVFGPGSLRGQPAKVSDEQLALVHAIYALQEDGTRMFDEVDLCWRKGTAKSTLAGWLLLAELDPDAPVRGLDGHPVTDPYIPLLAFTEDQAASVTFRTVLAVAKGSLNSQSFRITDNFIARADDTGRLEPVSGSPSARDGAINTSCQCMDEGHRLVSDRLHEALSVMAENRMKTADSWQLCTTTSWEAGAGSFAEVEDERARTGRPHRLLYVFRGADPAKWDLTTEKGAAGALGEASPPGTPPGHGVLERWRTVKDDPKQLRYWGRVWCNIPSEGEASMDRPAYEDIEMASVSITAKSSVAFGLAREGRGGVIAGTDLTSSVGWIVGRYSTVSELEDALRAIVKAIPRPRKFTVEAIQLNRDRWLPEANRWVGDRDLNRRGRMLEHKAREEHDIIVRYLEASPGVRADEEAQKSLLAVRIVDLPDGKTVTTHANADFMALAFSYDAAQTRIRQGIDAKGGGMKMYDSFHSHGGFS